MYVIGVDGGGTKTESMVADMKGKIIATGVAGPSNPRNVGIEKTVLNITEAVKKSFSRIESKDIFSIFVGIPGFAEEYGEKEEEIREKLAKRVKDFSVNEENINIGSDQEVAFRSGTDKKEGAVVISGTGSVTRGWRGKKDVKTSGWGWLVDGGGAFQVGQKGLKKTVEALDGRIKKSILTDLLLQKFNAQNINDLNKIIYQENPIEKIAPFSLVVSEAAERGDEVAKNILFESSNYLVEATKNTINQLQFKAKFPLVLVGGMFKSGIFLSFFKKEVSSFCPKADIILPKNSPTIGAVKIAIEKING